MGLAVLPARLKTELEMLARKILNGEDLRDNELTKKHADWAEKFLTEYDDISEENINEIIKYFEVVLMHCKMVNRFNKFTFQNNK